MPLGTWTTISMEICDFTMTKILDLKLIITLDVVQIKVDIYIY